MKNCPKCGDPVSKGETFCGKCGNIITSSSEKSDKNAPTQNVPATPTPAQTATSSPEVKKKRKLWPIFLAATFFILLAAIIGLLFLFGIFGKGAAIKKYVQNTEPDFSAVVEDINNLEKNLTYESTAETEEEIKAEIDSMKKEIDSINKLKENAQKAKNNLGIQKSVRDTERLNNNLTEFYNQIDTSMATRKNIIEYFYQTQILAEKMVKASGASDNVQTQDLVKIADNLYQFKIALDVAISEFEMINVPEELKELHEADVDMLKKLSKNLGDMVTSLKNWDDVGFTSAYNRFESTMNEYDTKISKQYLKKLAEEFKKLNNVLSELNTKKDAIEDDYSFFKGKYRIEGAVLDLLKNL